MNRLEAATRTQEENGAAVDGVKAALPRVGHVQVLILRESQETKSLY